MDSTENASPKPTRKRHSCLVALLATFGPMFLLLSSWILSSFIEEEELLRLLGRKGSNE